MDDKSLEKKYNKFIITASTVIPVFVAILFGIKLEDFGFDVEPLSFLPPIYTTINGVTAVVLVVSVIAIKKGNRNLHERLMTTAMAFSVIFLIMYVAYHMTASSTMFGDSNHNGILEETELLKVGNIRYLYFFILITHILLSIIIIPFILITYVRALVQRFDKHKKIAKLTFFLWLYVTVTGVIVYLMILPYYVW